MKGQDDSNPALIEMEMIHIIQKPWQRIIILFAGPFCKLLF